MVGWELWRGGGTTPSSSVGLSRSPSVGSSFELSSLFSTLLSPRGRRNLTKPFNHLTYTFSAHSRFCLSAPKTDMDNIVAVSGYAAMDRILRDERKYILNMCKRIKKCGANVVLIQKSILRDAYNELSLHFLAKMGILSWSRM